MIPPLRPDYQRVPEGKRLSWFIGFRYLQYLQASHVGNHGIRISGRYAQEPLLGPGSHTGLQSFDQWAAWRHSIRHKSPIFIYVYISLSMFAMGKWWKHDGKMANWRPNLTIGWFGLRFSHSFPTFPMPLAEVIPEKEILELDYVTNQRPDCHGTVPWPIRWPWYSTVPGVELQVLHVQKDSEQVP
jgi:hypothetical protein